MNVINYRTGDHVKIKNDRKVYTISNPACSSYPIRITLGKGYFLISPSKLELVKWAGPKSEIRYDSTK